MSIKLKVTMLIFSILLILIIFRLIKKEKMPILYSLSWLLVGIVFLILGIFPEPIIYLQQLLGFETLSNMILFILSGLLLLITMFLTIIVSKQRKQIYLLIQEISIKKKGK